MKAKKHIVKVLLFLISLFALYKSINSIAFAAENVEQKEVKVLVIEINPFLETKGMKVTDFLNTFGFDQSLEKSINELKDDIEYSSDNIVKCIMVGQEYLNEFPKYTQDFTLSHYDDVKGERIYTGKGFQLDEATYLDMFGKGWYGWWETDNPVIGEGIDSYPFKFDYNYLIEKLDLVNRRNNNEFDMVWVFSIDPVSMGEINMVGKSAFWVDGDIISKDCNNFVMGGFTLSRRDTTLECIGHMAESMLNYVYEVSDISYNSIIEFSDIGDLNTWQRFYLCKNKAPANWDEYGIGQIHFAPNSISDYDWSNLTTVQSTWEDWKYNYPNLTGATTAFNSAVYDDGIMSVARAHCRWWLSLVPHCQGRDNNGYSHNWWDYIIATDYVQSIETYNTYKETSLDDYYGYIILEKGELLTDLKFRLYYRSGKEEDFVIDNCYNFVNIENENIIKIENSKIKALEIGETRLTLNYDGRTASYGIFVVDNKDYLYYRDFKVNPSSKTLYYNEMANNEMSLAVAAPPNIDYSVSFFSENASIAKVSKDGKVTAVGKGTTFIITKITIGDKSKEFKTKIISKKASIEITNSKASLKIGEQFTFKAKAYGLSGSFIWSVSNSGIISINSKTGKLAAKNTGTAYVIVKSGKFTCKFKVTVK